MLKEEEEEEISSKSRNNNMLGDDHPDQGNTRDRMKDLRDRLKAMHRRRVSEYAACGRPAPPCFETMTTSPVTDHSPPPSPETIKSIKQFDDYLKEHVFIDGGGFKNWLNPTTATTLLKEEEGYSRIQTRPHRHRVVAEDKDKDGIPLLQRIKDGLRRIHDRRVSEYAACGRPAPPCFETMTSCSPVTDHSPPSPETIKRFDDYLKEHVFIDGGGSKIWLNPTTTTTTTKEEGSSRIQTPPGGGGGVVDEDKDGIPVLHRDEGDEGEEGNDDQAQNSLHDQAHLHA